MTVAIGAKPDAGQEWYSPAEVVNAAREVMGSIMLDPASCPEANETVKAERFYTLEEDGLQQAWNAEAVWLNPPFKNVSRFVYKLIREYRFGGVPQAVLLVHNSTETKWFQHAMKYAAAKCFAETRLKFRRPGGELGGGQLQGHVLFYFGPNKERFWEVFAEFGATDQPKDETVPGGDQEQLVTGIKDALSRSVDGYLDAGRLLTQAKDELGFSGDEWERWLTAEIGISKGYAYKLISIAGNPTVVSHVRQLPRDVAALYELSRVGSDVLAGVLTGDQGAEFPRVYPGMSRHDAVLLARELRGDPVTTRPQPPDSVKDLRHQLDVAQKRIADLEQERGPEPVDETEPAGEPVQLWDEALWPVFQQVKHLTEDGKNPDLVVAYKEFSDALDKLNRCLAEAKEKGKGQEE